ncbi:histone methylation protein DOT1-domain-containing protein [Abortiporus biennis]|nr:histone methylation protein DOT1-domain-containing protein [Abortiporus biennis]
MHAPRHGPSASSDLSFFSKSKSTRSGTSTPTTNATVTKRVTVQRSITSTRPPAVKVVVRDATPSNLRSNSSATPPVVAEPPKKRRALAETDALPPTVKRPRLSASPGHSRASSLAPSVRAPSTRHSSLAPIAEGVRSRSTSIFTSSSAPPIMKERWIEEDGKPGPGFLSSEDVVKTMLDRYKSYFSNPADPENKNFEVHPTRYPVAELEYPNTHSCERYILLVPKDKDHYNPIMCLEIYLTPEQRELFGTLPDTSLADLSDDSFDRDSSPIRPNSPPPGLPQDTPTEHSVSSASSPASLNSDSSLSSLSSVTSITSVSSTLSSLSSLSAISQFYPPNVDLSNPPSINFLRRLRRAINKRDGPEFINVMDAINAILRSIKYPTLPNDQFEPTQRNTLPDVVKTWTPTGIPKKVLYRLIEENYQRVVGPHAIALNKYEAFSSEVYGELLPSFISDLIKDAGINSESFFVDLGCGVGNVVLQASLETGCKSYGIELLPLPANLAKQQLASFQNRCRMWGINMGDVELEEGDMLTSKRVVEAIKQADVVLINNKVFSQELHENIKPTLLELKEGAIVISLKPFAPSRLNERTIDDMCAYLRVEERQYSSGSVSWGSGGGSYYLQKVDRAYYEKIKRQLESSRTSRSSSVRSTRSRR